MKLLAIVVVVMMSGVVAAQPSPASYDLLLRASASSHSGDHAQAIALYQQAYANDADPELLAILGAEYRSAGQPREAVQQYCAYLLLAHGREIAFATHQVRELEAQLGTPIQEGQPVCSASAPGAAPLVTRAAPLHTRISPREVAGLATITVGLVALGAGVYYKLDANRIGDDLDHHLLGTPWPAGSSTWADRGQRDNKLATQFLVAGSLAAATGLGIYISGRISRIAGEHVILAPTVTPGGGGLALSGGF